MHRTITILIFLICCLSGFAQDALDNRRIPYLQFNYHSGSFWTRSEFLAEEFSDPYRAIEARLGFQLTGNEIWEQYHNFPKVGLGMHYSDLVKDRSDTVVGNPFSLFGFYSAPWLRVGRFTLSTDMSVGLSYADVIYDSISNPYNDVIASHVNLYFDFNLNMNVKLTPRLGLNAGYGITHYSNGRMQAPQKGINNWGWLFGLDYLLGEPASEFNFREPESFQTNESIQLMYAAGLVEYIVNRSTRELRFFTSSFTADYVSTLSPRMAVTFGLEALYDGSLKRAIPGVLPEDASTWQQMYLASHLGYHYIIERFTILFNFGTYFRQHSYDRGYYFARLGGRWRFTDQLYAHICVKTKNAVRSDWIEWGAAYQINLRK
ncbi:MAG: acyloxyacyl hydrolase [Bacteroidales bacterium]|nr:acyloxyacyl hydrolase [Bacteroidales bacterium]